MIIRLNREAHGIAAPIVSYETKGIKTMKLSYRITGPHTGGMFKVNLVHGGNTVAFCPSREAASGIVQVLNAMNDAGARQFNITANSTGETHTTSFIYSPDDGGYYAQQYDLDNKRDRVTKRSYHDRAACLKDVRNGTAKWEKWT